MERRLKDMIPTRRDLIKWGSLALASTWVDQTVWPLQMKAAGKANPRGTARNCILIEMAGAMSQVDCWDFKETRWTPKDLDVQKVPGVSGLYLSKTLFPTLGQEMQRIALVRSMRANELVHFNGQYHVLAGRSLAPAIAREIPAFGSIIAYELEKSRRESDTFPTYISTGLASSRCGALASGFLPARFTGLNLEPQAVLDTFGVDRTSATELLEERWRLLSALAEVSQAERNALGDKATAYGAFSHEAQGLLSDHRWQSVFKVTDEEKNRYGKDEFGLGCILARNLIGADAGTRFVFLFDGDKWDHHGYIFDHSKPNNHYMTCTRLDKGLGNLIRDLAAMPGKEAGKTLLDETLIVLTSEFGRTPDMNPVEGRDHWSSTFTSAFLGGGVKGGRIIGKTDDVGGRCIDPGWKHKEQPYLDNITATIYSALGIDWKKSATNTPSGRDYDYVQTAPLGTSEFISNDEIAELFE